MRNSDDNAPQDQNLIGASVTDLTAEDINTSENSPYTATATAVDRVDAQGDSQTESRADKDGSDVLDTPDISFLLKDYDNHFDGLGDLSFSQEGSDLRVVDGDGNEYIIAGYFDEAPPPSLRISESTELPFDFVQTLLAGTDLPAASGETPRATMVDAHDYAEYGSSIGNVETIVGEVKIIRTDGQTQILEAGDPVFEGDQILTETGASVKLVFLDNTLFSLGEDAQMTLDKMLYNAEEESGEVVLSMLKGMFLFVSGKIAKTDPTDMVVNTPVATIGIRGTIVTGRIDPDAQQTFEITVIDGAIATIPSGSDEPIVMSESFSTIIGENNAAGNLEISQSQETPQAVVARNVQQFSVLSSEDLQGIELAVESSAAESGEDVDLDLESALEIAVENETLGDVDAEQEDAVVDTPIPDAPAAVAEAEEVQLETDVLLEAERPLEEIIELEEENDTVLEPEPEPELELDITPPDPPLFVLAVNENNYLESGNSIIEGETEAGALVSVTLAGSLTNPDGTVSQSEAVFETVADDAGTWTIDFENDDPVSGNYDFAEESEVQLSVTAADASGNVSDEETGSFNFDLTAPEAPVIAPDSSVSYTASDNTTYINGSSLAGTAEAGTNVSVSVSYVSKGENIDETLDVTADENGNWSLDLKANGIKPDHDTELSVSAQSEDKAGNLGETATQTYVVDSQTTAPQIAFGGLENGATDNSPALSGTAEPGATVEVIVDDGKNSETFSVDADSNGNWTLDLDQESDGTLSLTHDVTLTAKATATDLAGNSSGTSSTSVKVDNSTTLSDVKFDKVVDGAVDGDPLLSGTAEPGSEVVVTVTDGNNNQTTFTPTVDASGNWSVTIVSKDDFEIKDGGSFSVKVDSKDELGNTDSVDLGSYTVDASTTLTNVAFEKVDNGAVGAEPVLKGIAEPGAEVTVIVTDKEGNKATFKPEVNDETGAWSVDIAKDTPTSGSVTVSDTGTLSAVVDSKDNLDNEATQVSLGPYDVDASVSVSDVAFADAIYPDDDSPGTVGDDPVLSGKAEVGSTVTVTVTNEDQKTATFIHTVDSTGEWSIQIVDQGEFEVNHNGTLVVGVDVADDLGNTEEVALDLYKVDAFVDAPTIEFDVASDGFSDNTPQLSGSAEAGATVHVTISDDDNNSVILNTTADGSGNWSLDIDEHNAGNVSLENGSELTATATATDIHKNESEASVQAEATVDAFVDAPTIEFDVASDGSSDKTPQLSGSAEAGATVHVTISDDDNNSVILNTTADGSGNWSLDIDEHNAGNVSLENGSELTATATATDIHKNESEASVQAEATVDAFVDAPTIEFDVASDGSSDKTPQLSGSAEAGATVHVTISDDDNNSVILNTTADGSGNWSLDIDEHNAGNVSLENGSELTATATATDIHKNESEASVQAEATVDAFVDAPTIEFDVASDGSSDKTPQLSGSAEAGATVHVTISDDDSNSVILNTTADGSGNWSLDIDENNAGNVSLENGSELTATATATDIHKNESETSVQAEATVDVEAVVGTFAFEGASGNTVGEEPVLSGQAAEPNAKVIVVIEDTDTTNKGTFSTTADAYGNWSITVKSGGDSGTDALDVTHEMPFSVSVTVIDKHNNSKTVKSEDTYTVDALTTLSNVGFEDVTSSGLTDGTPALSGKAEPGSEVVVTVTGSASGTTTFTTTADSESGEWSVSVINGDGFTITDNDTLTATVVSTDSVGNSTTETASATVDNSIDTLSVGFEDVTSSGLTDGTPSLSGKAEPGSEVVVTVTGTESGTTTFTTTADSESGEWSVSVINGDGFTITDNDTLTATVVSTDSVGNSTTETASATVDNSIDTLSVGFEDVTSSGLTDGTPSLSGKAEPGSEVVVTVTGTESGTTTFTTTADSESGEWSVSVINGDGFTITDNDTLTATVVSTDSVGNSTTETASATVDNSIDTLSVGFEDVTSSGLTDGTPSLSGKAEPGSEVVVTVTGTESGTTTFTTTADSESGEWSVSVINGDGFTITDNDTLTATVVSTDSVGNSTTETASATVDNSIDTLSVGFEDVTSSGLTDGTPSLSGKAEPGSEVVVTVTGTESGTTTFTTTADSESGEWSVSVINGDGFTITDNDTLTATVVSTDSVGNSTTETASATVDNSIDTLSVGFEDVTSSGLMDGTPSLSGKAEPGSEVVVTVTGTESGTTTFTTTADSESGEWSVSVINGDGFTITDNDTLTATVVSTDSVGNSTTETASATVDNSIDTLSVGFEDVTSSGLMDGTPSLSGKAEPGSEVVVTVTGTESGTTTFTTTADSESGEWSVSVINGDGFTITDNDTLTATVVSTDSVGNSTTETASATVDNSIDTLSVGFEDVTSSGLTDGTPSLSGKAEPGSEVVVTVTGTESGTTTFTTTADSESGEWSVSVINGDGFTITDNDTLTATVVSTDSVGNSTTETASATVDNSIGELSVGFEDVTSSGLTDGTPALSGKAEPGSEVVVTVTGTESGTTTFTTTADSESGEWSVSVINGDGFTITDNDTLTATVVSTDSVGNSTTETASATVDNSIDTLSVGFEDVTSSGLTDGTPSLSGKAEPGSEVVVTVTGTESGTTTFTTTADSESGEWSVSVINGDGFTITDNDTLTATVVSTDSVGNSTTETASATVDNSIDTLSVGFEDVTSSGLMDGTPSLSGKAEPGSEVVVTVTGTESGTTTFTTTADSESGEWSVSVINGDGFTITDNDTLTATVVSTDSVGNSTTETASATVDNSIDTLSVGFEDVTSSGLMDGTPSLSGKAEPGSEVVVTVTGTESGTTTFTTTADSESGEWSVSVINGDGFTITDNDTLTATVVSTDSVGNSTTETASATVDNSIDTLSVGFEDVTSSGLTDGTPSLSGKAEPGSEVVVTVTGTESGTTTFTTTADSESGEWSVSVINGDGFTITDNDTLTATVVSTDSVGNSTTETASATVDNSIGELSVGFEDVTSSGLTDGTPALSGKAEPGSEVVVTVTGTESGTTTFTTTADSESGEWSVSVINGDGFTITDNDTLTATVVSTDSVGNSTTETASATVDNSIDTLSVGFEDVTSSGLTDGTPSLSGKAEPGSEVVVTVTGTESGTTTFTTTADSESGEWSVSVINGDGFTITDNDTLTATVVSTDSVGNSTTETASATVDNSIDTLSVGFEDVTSSGLMDGTPSLSGKAEPGSEVVVTVTGTESGTTTFTTTADSESGEWSVSVINGDGFTITDNDTLTATVVSTDSVGNSTTETASATVDNSIDTLSVGFEDVTSSGLTDGTPSLSGKAEPGSEVVVTVTGTESGTTTFTTTADSESGEWSVSVINGDGFTITDNDTLTATVVSTDSVGNSTTETASATVDNSIDTLSVGFEDVTSSGLTDGTPSLSGKAEPGSEVVVTVTGTESGTTTFTTTADSESGEWSVSVINGDGFTITDNDTLTATVVSTDSVGNSTTETASATVDNSIDTLSVGFEDVTSSGLMDGTPALSGKAEPGSEVVVTVTGTESGTTTFTTTADSESGEWSVSVINGDGFTITDNDTLTATVVSTDSVGNSTTETASATVDNSIDTLSVGFEDVTSSGLTDGTPSLSGKAEPGSEVVVTVTGTESGTTTFTTTADSESGEWSVSVINGDGFTITDNDTLTATVVSTDSVGNSTTETASATVDNSIDTLSVGFEDVTSSGLTDGTPSLSGKAEPGSEVVVTVTGTESGTTTFTTTADSESGEWSVSVINGDGFTITDNDTLTATVVSTDSVGNSTTETASATVDNSIDTLSVGFEDVTSSGLMDGTPSLSGKAEPGSEVVVTVTGTESGTTTFTTTADSESGEWSVSVINGDGFTITDNDTLTATVVSTDSVGNSTTETASATVDNSIDTLSVGFEDVTSSGLMDGTPSLSGKAEPGSEVVVTVTGTESGTTTFTTTADSESGEWSVSVINGDGFTITDNDTLTATVVSTDSVGNSTTETASATVDNSIDTLSVGFEDVTSSGLTDGTPSLSGKAEPGSEVVVTVTGTESGTTTFTTTADSESGEWSVSVINGDGFTITDNDTLTATVVSTDSVGNSTTETASATVDNSIDTLSVGFEDVTSSGLTDGTPSLSGKAEPGSEVVVTVTGTESGTTTFTTTADSESGEWSVSVINGDGFTITDNDTLTATVVSTDSVGNSTTETASATVDNSIDTLSVGFEDVTSSGLMDGTPSLSGKAEPGSEVVVTVTGTESGTTTFTTTADSESGEWSVSVINGDGFTITDNDTLTATVVSTDSVGNSTTETASATVDNSIDTLSVGFEDVTSSGLTDGTPSLSGKAEPGSEVVVTVTGTESGTTTFTTTADSESGEWSVSVINGDGFTITDNDTLTATVVSTDSVGNSTTETASATVDNSIGELSVGFEDVTSSGLTDGTPALSGKAEPGSEVVVTVTGTESGTTTFTTTADSESGEWSVSVINGDGFTITDNDTLTATVVSTDSVGNSTTETASATVDNSIDTLSVGFEDVTSSGLTDGTPSLSGKAEPGSEVVVTVTGTESGTTTFTTTADSESGEWSVSVINGDGFTITDNDTLTATVVSTDSVGNSTTETASATVDNSIDTLSVGFEDVTSSGLMDGTPSLSGKAEPGSEVVVTVTGTESGTTTFTTTADSESGEWSVSVINGDGFTITDNDTLTATVVSTDSVGNSTTETASATVDNSIDTLSVGFEDVTSSGLTDGTPSLSGKAEPGSEVVVTVTGTESGTTTFTTTADSESGEWSVSVINGDGFTITDNDTLTATVVSTDSVGNSTTETASATVDNSIDTLSVGFEDVTSSGLTDGTPSLSGKAEPGSEVVVTVTGTESGTTTFTTTADSESGEWSVSVINGDGFTITDNDTLTATVVSTDSVGNSTTETASATVDNSTYLTNVAFDNILNDTTVGGKPVLSGVAEVGATVTVVVTDATDSTKTATYTHVVTDSGGNWSIDIVDQGSFTVTNGGSFSVKVDSEDKLGNDATTVNLGPYTVDAVAADPEVFVLDQTPENIAKLVAGDESLFYGTADPNAAIKVEVTFPSGSTPASLTLDAQANGSGDWAISFNDLGSNKTAFTHGAAITLAVTATDPILNVSNTVTETYTVDYTTNETVDDNTFAGTTGDEVNFETQKADYLGPVSLTDSITSATTSKDEITTLTSFDDTVFVEDRGATYTNLGDGDDTIKFLKDEIAGVTGGTVFVDGGDGDDTADFSELTSSLYVNLSATAGTDVVRHTMSDGSILYRSFNDVENISTSSGRDLVEINRLTDLPNIDAGDGIDRLVLSQGGSTNIIDLTGGTSTIDGNTVTMSGFEVFETGTNLDSVNTVIVDRDAVYVNGGSSAVSSSADYDTLQVSESGTVNFAAVDVATDGYTYAGLHEYMTYATFFEKIEVSSDALMVLQTDEWQLKGATNSTATSGVSNINISADASSGLMIDIESLWLNSSHWSYNDGTGETYLSTFTDSTSVQHNGSAYLRHGTEDLQIDLDADAVAAINNTYVHKNDGYGVPNTYNWSALTWYNGINVKQADQDESNHHVVLAEAIGYADNITIDAATNGVTIQSLTGAANLTLDENLTITGDMYDYIGAVTINNGHKLDVGGTLDMSASSEMIMSYSTSTGAAVSADHIDFAGSVELHVDYSSVNPNNADPQTGIIEEWAVFDASSTSGSIDELIFKTSNGSEFVDSDLGAVVLVGTADGGVQVVKYDSSKHTLDDGSNDLTGTTNSEVYYGFAGDDSITISDYDSDSDGVNDSVHLQYLDGGEGHDTLALDGNADSFQSLFTDELFRINRIETLDISDLEGTLTLDEAAVLGLSDLKGSAKDGITGAYSEWTELTIEGDGNTTLDLNGFAVDTSTSLARSGYTVYKSADSVVYVDDEIGTVK